MDPDANPEEFATSIVFKNVVKKFVTVAFFLYWSIGGKNVILLKEVAKIST